MKRREFLAMLPALALIRAADPGMLGAINNTRRAHGLGEVATLDTLDAAAIWMAGDLARGTRSHTDSLGRDAGTRLRAFGYTGAIYGEVAGWLAQDLATTLSWWLNSPPHRSVILDPRFTAVGIGRVDNCWVAAFGVAAGRVAPAPRGIPNLPSTSTR
jgi:uncharacterized protein YkwD